jgi:purine-binding chemotaxis protein CheW
MASVENGSRGVTTGADGGDQYLTIRIGTETCAVEILKVQEIRGYTELTPIPHAPFHIKGVLDVRGAVVPVIGLRERFGMEPVTYDKFTVILLLSFRARVVGLVVDGVSDVLMVKPEEVSPPPELGRNVDTSFLRGIAKTGGHLTLLLDVDSVVGDLEGVGVGSAAA